MSGRASAQRLSALTFVTGGYKGRHCRLDAGSVIPEAGSGRIWQNLPRHIKLVSCSFPIGRKGAVFAAKPIRNGAVDMPQQEIVAAPTIIISGSYDRPCRVQPSRRGLVGGKAAVLLTLPLHDPAVFMAQQDVAATVPVEITSAGDIPIGVQPIAGGAIACEGPIWSTGFVAPLTTNWNIAGVADFKDR